jgi:hypothetical protein
MRTKTPSPKAPAEWVLKGIRRATRKHYAAEDKIRIVLEGLRGEDSTRAISLLSLLRQDSPGSCRRKSGWGRLFDRRAPMPRGPFSGRDDSRRLRRMELSSLSPPAHP